MERICNNCKNEYSIEYGVCPFCGEKNDMYDKDKSTLDEYRDLVADEQQDFVEDDKKKQEEEIDEEKLKEQGCPKTYLMESVLATIFCCFPVGIFGIINANRVESLYRNGQYKKAFESSQKARKLFIASIITGIILGLAMIIWGIVYISNQATYINLSEEYISTGPKEFSRTIDVESDGKWDVEFSSPWISASKNKNGKGFLLGIKKNTTGEYRTGWVTISSGSLQARIAVEQNGTATYLTADSTQLRYGQGRVYSQKINVQTDGIEWKIKKRPDFGSIEKQDDYLRSVL
ncbi:MAG: CD225/dispanin family protein [Bacteroidales bacterium]|nr:CD225/dispanin family protein [Bacteroidales bacterium]